MTEKPNITTWADLYKEKPVQQPAPKETPGYINQMNMNLLKKYDRKRYNQEVWLKFRLEVDPNATLADLPEELQ